MKKNKITGLIGTIVLHAVLLILLLVIAIRRPQMQEEGGVPVMLGNTELSQGNADPYTLTDVDIMNEPEAPAPDISEPEPVPGVDVKEEGSNDRPSSLSPHVVPESNSSFSILKSKSKISLPVWMIPRSSFGLCVAFWLPTTVIFQSSLYSSATFA